MLQVVEVEIDNVIGDVPTWESGNNGFCSSLAAKTAAMLSGAVKSESVTLNTELAEPSPSVSVSSMSSSAHSVSADICHEVSVKCESELSPQDQQTELVPGCHDNWCRTNGDGDLLHGVRVKQEPMSPVTDIVCDLLSAGDKCQLPSSHSELTSAVSLFSSQTTDTQLKVGTNADRLTIADIDSESGADRLTFATVRGEFYADRLTVGNVDSGSGAKRQTVANVDSGSGADRLTVTTVKGEFDADRLTVANVDSGSGADRLTVATVNGEFAAVDVNVTSSSESQTCFSEALQLPVSSSTVSSLVSSSLSSSSDAMIRNTAVSVPQELVQCRDAFGKTYYIPRRLLLDVQSLSAVNRCSSRTERSLSSSCFSTSHSTNVASLTSSGSTRKCEILSSVCDVAAVTLSKAVVNVQSNSHFTTCSNLCTVPVQPSLLSMSCHAVARNTTLSSTALTTATMPLSAQSTSTVSCVSCTSLSTRTTPSSQQLRQVCLTSNKCKDQVRIITSVPYSVLNSAVIKPRPLVPLCSVNSPARSLPHITFLPHPLVPSCNVNSPARSLPHITSLPGISSVVQASHNVAPVSVVPRTQRPTSQMTAKLATSSNPPVYFVVGGNNKVISSVSSRSLMEVVVVPAIKDLPQKAVCSVQPVVAAGVNGRCINRLSAGLTRRDEAGRVSCSSVSSTSHSVICTPSLNRTSKSCSSSQISLLRPQTVAVSAVTSKLSVVEPRAQMKRMSSSSSLNVFATKIGNQTVIVDIGGLSSTSSAAVKPTVTAVTSASSTKPKHMVVSKTTCSQHDTSSVCDSVLLRSSSPCKDIPSTVPTDELFKNCASVIRYFTCFLFFILLNYSTLIVTLLQDIGAYINSTIYTNVK